MILTTYLASESRSFFKNPLHFPHFKQPLNSLLCCCYLPRSATRIRSAHDTAQPHHAEVTTIEARLSRLRFVQTMRTTAIPSILALLSISVGNSSGDSSFASPFANHEKRQTCPSGYNSCAALGKSDICCPSNTNCALDQAKQIACCPINAVCTGTLAGTIAATGSTSSSPFILGVSSTATTPAAPLLTPSGVAGGGSTVPNAPYPFVYIPTSYANAALCSSYWTYCQVQSTSCLAALGGQVNGVTISGPAGGVTVAGAATTVANPSSVCSVLSTSACYNLEVATCTLFGNSANTTPLPNDQPVARPTACPRIVYLMGAGAAVGAAGVLL